MVAKKKLFYFTAHFNFCLVKYEDVFSSFIWLLSFASISAGLLHGAYIMDCILARSEIFAGQGDCWRFIANGPQSAIFKCCPLFAKGSTYKFEKRVTFVEIEYPLSRNYYFNANISNISLQLFISGWISR